MSNASGAVSVGVVIDQVEIDLDHRPRHHPTPGPRTSSLRSAPRAPAIAPLYGLDGGEQIGAATGRLLCGGFFLVNATYVCLIWELIRAHEVSPTVRGIMRFRSVTTLCLFGIAAIVALKYPPAGLGICICCLIVYLKPDPARIGEVKNLTKDAGAAEADRSFVDLSALRRDPARFGLCRFCASALAKAAAVSRQATDPSIQGLGARR